MKLLLSQTDVRSAAVGNTSAPTGGSDNQLNFSDYYLWEEPALGLEVYLNYRTIDRLQVEILRGSNGSPADGAEIGGILLGRRQQVANRKITLIEDIEQIPCSRRAGRHYTLSKADGVIMNAVINRRQSGLNSSLSVIGYFRSHLRDDLFLSADDLTTIHRFFKDSADVFLVIKALPSRACTAAIFFWEDGHIQSEFAYNEVPLSPVPENWFVDPEGKTETRTSKPALKTRLVLGGSVVAVAATLVLVAFLSYRPTIGSPRHAPSVLPATSALAPSEKLAASVVQTSLSVPPASKPRIAVAEPPPSSHRPFTKPAAPIQSFVSNPRANRSSELSPVLPDPLPSTPSNPTLVLSDIQPDTLAAVRRTNIDPQTSLPAFVEPRLAAPAVTSTTPMQTESRSQRSAVVARPKVVSYSEPQVLRRVNPVLARQVQSAMTSDIEVEVIVFVDTNGAVTDARVTSTKGALPELVTTEALRAARLYRFRPAQEGAVAVASQMILSFRFRRANP